MISIALHVLLFGFIIFSSLNRIIKRDGGDQNTKVINSIMIDQRTEIANHNNLEQNKNITKKAVTDRKKWFQEQKELQELKKNLEDNHIKSKQKEQYEVFEYISPQIRVEQDNLIKNNIKEKIKSEITNDKSEVEVEEKIKSEITNDKSEVEVEEKIKSEITNDKSEVEEKIKSEIAKAKSEAEEKIKSEIAKAKSEAEEKIKSEIAKVKYEAKEKIKSEIAKAKSKAEKKIKSEIAKAKSKSEEKIKSEIAKAKSKSEEKIKIKKTTKVLKYKKRNNSEKKDAKVNDLIDVLSSQLPTTDSLNVSILKFGNEKSTISSLDISNYVAKIKSAIESKFYNANIYRGKKCELRIKLSPDGMLISIATKTNAINDKSLCDLAIRTAKSATIPKPPSSNIYDFFNKQESILVFSP